MIYNILLFLGFVRGSFWLYSTDFFKNSTLKFIKSLMFYSEDLNNINHKVIFEALFKLNKNFIRNILLKKVLIKINL